MTDTINADAPVSVHVASVADTASLGAAPAPAPKRFRTVYRTIQVNSNDNGKELWSASDRFIYALVQALDDDITIAKTRQDAINGIGTVIPARNTAPSIISDSAVAYGANATGLYTGGGGGTVEVIGTQPASDSPFTYVLPYACTLASVTCQLTNSATAGNRFVQLEILDGSGNTVWNIPGTGAVIANGTASPSWVQGFSNVSGITSGTGASGLPATQLEAGWTVKILVSGMVSGDQLSKIVLLINQGAGSGTDSRIAVTAVYEA